MIKKFQEKSRNGKMDLFYNLLSPKKTDKVLTLGEGTGGFFTRKYLYKKNILACDLSKNYLKQLKKNFPDVKTKVIDLEEKLPFKDNEFDIGFSNAVIEHLENQEQFASEVQRVCKNYFISCPNKMFPFEMHYRLPFFQFVGEKQQKWLVKRFKLGNYDDGVWEKILLPTKKSMKKWFTQGKVFTFFYGYNIIAYKRE